MAGKTAIVTGAAGGIGASTVKLFCGEGAQVLLVDENVDQLSAVVEQVRREQPDARLEAFGANTAAYGEAVEAARIAVSRFGTIDVLVNNAAIRDVDSISNADNEKWVKVLETNVIGTLNFCRATLPALRRSGKGSIVNVSSCYAIKGRKGFAAYDASKAAVLAMTRTLASEEAAYGIRVNAVCPGGTLTPFTIGRGKTRGRTEAEMRAETKNDALLPRWAEPREVAYPILWLASDEGSFVTGVTLMVDGGLAIL